MYVIEKFEPALMTVGFYRPDGKFVAHSDHTDRDEAEAVCGRLNGGDGGPPTDAIALLDLFAGQTLAGYVAGDSNALAINTNDVHMEQIARMCFRMSKAMLKVRPEFQE